MKAMLALTVVAALLLCCGCGGDSHESLAAEAVSTNKDLLATLETVKDEASAKAAKPKLKSLVEKMNDMTQQVSHATAEQKKGGEPVVKAMENSSEIARDNLATVQEMSKATANPAQQAQSPARPVPRPPVAGGRSAPTPLRQCRLLCVSADSSASVPTFLLTVLTVLV